MKIVKCILLLIVVGTIIWASGQPEKAASEEATTITMMNILYPADPNLEDNPLQKILEEYTKTKLEISWIPQAAYQEKVNVTIASGDLPEIMMVRLQKEPSVVQAVRAGMFWEVGSLLDQYPNLAKKSKAVNNNISVDGKVYGIWRWRTLARAGIILRKDWLDKLGMAMPKTTDDVYKMAWAFTYKDPDGNGKQDTFGVTERERFAGQQTFEIILPWFGGPSEWEVEGGKFTPAHMTDAYIDALNWMKRLYDEKLINQDFAITKREQFYENFRKGRAGIAITVIDSIVRVRQVQDIDKNAKLDLVQLIDGPKGQRIQATKGYNGVFMFPKTSVKTEERLKRLLDFVDKTADPDMQNLHRWGIEGPHFEVKDGNRVRTREQYELFMYSANHLGQIYHDNSEHVIPDISDEDRIKVNRMYIENEPYVIHNPAEPLISDTYTEKGSELDKIIEDAKTKYIMGAIDMAGWKKAVAQWRKLGGDKIIQEYGEEYAKLK